MKLATVFVQVALVAVGIFVYDHLRSDDQTTGMPPDPVPISASTQPESHVPPAPIVLEGTGVASVLERQATLERRLEAMEKRLAARTTVVGDMSGYRPEAGSSPDAADPGEVDPETGARIPRKFGEQDIAWFRDLKKQADDIERHERYVDVYGRQLDRLDVTLTADLRSQVIEGMIGYRAKQRDLYRSMGSQNMSREDRQASLDKLQEEYNQTVYSLVPSSEAQKIVDSMTKNRSFGSRGRPGAGGRVGPR